MAKIYVVLRDVGLDLGEGYSSSSGDEFICAVSTFEKARQKIEELADEDGYGTDEVVVYDEDWDFIDLEFGDIYNTTICYHFKPVIIE